MLKIFFAILLFQFLLSCQSHNEEKQSKKDSSVSDPLPGKDQLIHEGELLTATLIAKGVIDSSVTPPLNEFAYTDTIVQLNDSIYYAIIRVGDQVGVCNMTFITTVRKKDQSVIDSRYLYPDCDIDFSADAYDYIEHRFASATNIILTRTTVYQKKDRLPGDDDANIERKDSKDTYLFISNKGNLVFEEEEDH